MGGVRASGIRAVGFSLGLALLFALSMPGCADDAGGDGSEVEDGEHDAFLDSSGKADAFGVTEKSPLALGILRLVNDRDLTTLMAGAGVSTRAANAIVAARVGKDGALGTHDDREVVTLAALDAIPWVGAKTFGRLKKFATSHGFVETWSLKHSAKGSVMAIGDLHGDVQAARTALQIAGAIDEQDRWIGGNLVVVQLGDVLDRGDGEREILDLFERLAPEAHAAGGKLLPLLGNHELMNVQGDLSYVTPAGFDAFDDVPDLDLQSPLLSGFSAKEKRRAAAFVQGGPYAKKLAKQNVVAIVGDSLFVHGGVLPKHVDYGLDAINYDAKAWMLWDDLDIPAALDAEDSPVWDRSFGEETSTDCGVLDQVLASTGTKRLVVAHTPQLDGITQGCEDKLFRIDTGMSAYYGGPVEVLEIAGPDVWIVGVSP
jgi:hypothetical protein